MIRHCGGKDETNLVCRGVGDCDLIAVIGRTGAQQ